MIQTKVFNLFYLSFTAKLHFFTATYVVCQQKEDDFIEFIETFQLNVTDSRNLKKKAGYTILRKLR